MFALRNAARASASPFLRGMSRQTNLPSVRAVTSSQFSRTFASAPATIKLTINGNEHEVVNGSTVLQACEQAGVVVPRFCFHDRLSIAGNCRMCLVEVAKSPKPVASCAMPAMPGMLVKTDSPLVHKAREGVMEFLLANHPLDCPICDQGGECDLQDQSMAYGNDRSRFHELKRGVEDKDFGPFVKTIMTRCIHCTRCVRFGEEVAGVEILGTTGRGNATEIGTYVGKKLDTEMSGNVVDLCPVGALTSKPYAMTARPWELRHTESFDVLDAVGASIRVDCRGPEILRILPRLNESVNEEWLADKSRFAYDGLKRQRLDVPMIRQGSEYSACDWPVAMNTIREKLQKVSGNELMGVAGALVDLESAVCLKDLMNRLGCSNIRPDTADYLSADIRSDYLFNTTIAGVEGADQLLIIGSNPRMEAPLINARIRKTVVHGGLDVSFVGPATKSTFPSSHLGDDASILTDILSGKHEYSKKLAAAERPMVLIGMGALNSADGPALHQATQALAAKYPKLRQDGWNGVNVLHSDASRAGLQDIGFTPGVNANTPESAKFVVLLGSDDPELIARIDPDAFVVYIGHHGDAGASRADLILPAAAYTEQSATYVNTEGRPQRTNAAVDPLGEAKEGWAILRALSEVIGQPLPYDSLSDVQERLVDVAPHFASLNHVESPSVHTAASANAPTVSGSLATRFDNYFMTDAISRSSRLMGIASKQLPDSRNSYL